METNKLNLIGSLDHGNPQNDLDDFISELNRFISNKFDIDKNINLKNNEFEFDPEDIDFNNIELNLDEHDLDFQENTISLNDFLEDDLALSEEDLKYNLDYYSDFDYNNFYNNYNR